MIDFSKIHYNRQESGTRIIHDNCAMNKSLNAKNLPLPVFSHNIPKSSVSVKLTEVLLSYDSAPSSSEESNDDDSMTFYCNPMLQDVLDPTTIAVSVEWWVGEERAHQEEFQLRDRSVGVLRGGSWSNGKNVSVEILVQRNRFTFPKLDQRI